MIYERLNARKNKTDKFVDTKKREREEWQASETERWAVKLIEYSEWPRERERDEGLMEEREKNISLGMNSVFRWDPLTVRILSWVTTQISQNREQDGFELGIGLILNLS